MIHHIYANRSNIGDWLSARGIQQLLSPLPVKEYLCDEPFVAETMKQLSASLRSDDLIIIGGGGLFSRYFHPFWKSFALLMDRAPFAIWGVGCCDIKFQQSLPSLDVLQPIIRKSRWCVVRDELTHRFLGCDSSTLIIPCPTINAVAAKTSASTGLLHVDHFDTIGEENFDTVTRLTEAFAKKTGRTYRQTNNLISAGNQRQFDDILERYRNAELVVTSRLHGCIIGLAMGCKVLAVSGDRKVESFMQAAGLGAWVCDVNELNSLPAMMANLPSQVTPHEFLQKVRQQNNEVAVSIIRHLSEHPETPR